MHSYNLRGLRLRRFRFRIRRVNPSAKNPASELMNEAPKYVRHSELIAMSGLLSVMRNKGKIIIAMKTAKIRNSTTIILVDTIRMELPFVPTNHLAIGEANLAQASHPTKPTINPDSDNAMILIDQDSEFICNPYLNQDSYNRKVLNT